MSGGSGLGKCTVDHLKRVGEGVYRGGREGDRERGVRGEGRQGDRERWGQR